jgi:hypothetical protein
MDEPDSRDKPDEPGFSYSDTIQLDGGSIEINIFYNPETNNTIFDVDYKGNVPEHVKDGITGLLKRMGCDTYDKLSMGID